MHVQVTMGRLRVAYLFSSDHKLPLPGGIIQEEFHKKFAFTMKPLLVKGGQKNWDAKEVFSMDYFRKIYPKDSEVNHSARLKTNEQQKWVKSKSWQVNLTIW